MVYIYDSFIVVLHPFVSLKAPFYTHCIVIAWKILSRMFFLRLWSFCDLWKTETHGTT